MRAFFLSRQLREKVLLVAFVALGALIWATGVLQRGVRDLREFRRARAELADQQRWLASRESIEAAAAAAIANLDSSRTFNAVRLSAEISAIANATGLGPNLTNDPPRTERTPQFSLHTLQFRLSRVPWEQLLKFYEELSERAPYINIEQFALSAERARPELLTASLRVSSVEIAR